jgi:putative peptidoglycan lipid II flippase
MVKGFRQIALLTAFSRVLGLLRDMSFSYFLSTSGLMDSWVIAFKIPNLTRRLFGEGAASALCHQLLSKI